MKKLFLLFTLMAVSMGAGAAEELYVGGVKVDLKSSGSITGSNITVASGGTLYYDSSTKRLTMKGVSISRTGNNNRGIRSSVESLHIVLEGTNSISTTSAAGIKFEADATITGSGSLSVTSSESAIMLTEEVILTINGPTITASGGDYSVNGDGYSNGSTVRVIDSNITIGNSSKGNAINNLFRLELRGTTELTMKGNSSKATVNNLTSLLTYDNIAIIKPTAGTFNSSLRTITASGATAAYTGDIFMAAATIVNSTNFPDSNFRSYILGQSYGSDGALTPKELANVKTIDVAQRNISTLKGIEFFTSLVNLYCNNNQLTSLDVSKNTLLSVLYCYSNGLTALDLTNNTKLTKLQCHKNQLSQLGLTNNASVTELWCHENKLASLNLAYFSSLRTLYCNDNQLTSLTLTNCKELREVYCYNNKLTALNVSAATYLTKLDCGGNQIKTLDVSNNVWLQELFCEQNKLSALDVSKCTYITFIKCHLNSIKDDKMASLVAGLYKNTSSTLHKLYVYNSDNSSEGNVCTSVDVATAKERGWTVYYFKNGSWTEYSGSPVTAINDTNFPERNFRAYVAQMLDKDQNGYLSPEEINNVTQILISQTDLNIDGYGLQGIEYFTQLKELYCEGCNLSNLNLKKNTQLTIMAISRNNFQNGIGLSKNTELKSLICNNCNLRKLDLTQNLKLESIDCSYNDLTEFTVNPLATKLVLLNIRHNHIYGDAMTDLVNNLPRTVKTDSYNFYACEKENVDGNQITRKQAAVAEAKNWNVYTDKYADLGDVNGDGAVDVADIGTIIDVMAGTVTDEAIKAAADVNGDGTVDVADIGTVIDIMAAN